MAILITDGPSSTNTQSVIAEAALAHAACIKVFAIGASQSVDRNELELISSLPRLEYHQWWTLGNLASLSSIESVVATELCRPEVGKLFVEFTSTVTKTMYDFLRVISDCQYH